MKFGWEEILNANKTIRTNGLVFKSVNISSNVEKSIIYSKEKIRDRNQLIKLHKLTNRLKEALEESNSILLKIQETVTDIQNK